MHSLDLASDGENFLAADEARVSLWNLNRDKACFTMYDSKLAGRNSELISSANFNQTSQSCLFLYTTVAGMINVCDFRERSDFSKRPSLQLNSAAANDLKGNFSKWLNYVSDAQFLNDASQVVSRDYMCLKLWDLRGGAKPIYSAQVTDYMERNLSALYEQDSLDDEFFLSVSPDSKHFVTGGYNKSAHVIDSAATNNVVVPCNYHAKSGDSAGKLKVYNK